MEAAEIQAMRDSMKTPAAPVVEEPIVAPIVEKIEEPIIEKAAETIKAQEPITELAPVVERKSFDEEFSERFDGKFKSADEIKAILNAPKTDEFADDEVRKINDLKKKGIKIDQEFFEIQNLNLTPDSKGEVDTKYVLLETLKRKPETKGYDKEMLEHHIDRKYNVSEWIDKDDADLTVDDKINRATMMRDAQEGLTFLTELKAERTFVKPVDESIVRKQNEERDASFRMFDSIVDSDVVAKVQNLSTVIDDKTGEKFDYKISEADGKEYGNLMKALARGEKNLFDQFAYTDDKGAKQINHQKVFEMLIKNKNYDQAVKNAFNDGKAVGAKAEIKELKNVNFTPSETKAVTSEPKSEAEAQKAAVLKKMAGG